MVRKIECVRIYQISDGKKILLIEIPADPGQHAEEFSDEEVEEIIDKLTDMFYNYDKVYLKNIYTGKAMVVRNIENKSFTFEVVFSENSTKEKP